LVLGRAGFDGPLLLGLFLLLALPGLAGLGLHHDEGFHGLAASWVLAPGTWPREIIIDGIRVAGRYLPVMLEPYDGAVMSYILAPFAAVLPPGPWAVRLPGVLLCAGWVWLIRSCCGLWFGRRAGFLAGLLAATNLLLLQYSRVALQRNEVLVAFFFWAALLPLTRWCMDRDPRMLGLTGFFLGLGLTLKITFLWYVVALGAAGVTFRSRLGFCEMRSRDWLWAGSGLAAGSALLILYNIERDFATLRLLWDALTAPTAVEGVPKGGVDNARYFEHLGLRFEHLWDLLRGEIQPRDRWGVWRRGWAEPLGQWTAVLCAGAMAWLPLWAWKRRKEDRSGSAALFFGLVFLLVFLQTPFTVSNFDEAHLLVLLPFPQLALALLTDRWMRPLDRFPRLAWTLCGLLLAPVLIHDLATHRHFDSEAAANGGYEDWSAAVYDAARYLRENGISSPVAFGLALRENVAFLTDREVWPELCLSPEPAQRRRAYARLSASGTMHWLWAETEEEGPCMEEFRLLAAQEGRAVVVEEVFRNRAGHPAAWLLRAQGKGTDG